MLSWLERLKAQRSMKAHPFYSLWRFGTTRTPRPLSVKAEASRCATFLCSEQQIFSTPLSRVTRPWTSTSEISFFTIKYIMVSFSVIVTNILTLEINTVHMLHYDTITFTVIVASAGPLEYHVLNLDLRIACSGLGHTYAAHTMRVLSIPPSDNLNSSILPKKTKVEAV